MDTIHICNSMFIDIHVDVSVLFSQKKTVMSDSGKSGELNVRQIKVLHHIIAQYL